MRDIIITNHSINPVTRYWQIKQFAEISYFNPLLVSPSRSAGRRRRHARRLIKSADLITTRAVPKEQQLLTIGDTGRPGATSGDNGQLMGETSRKRCYRAEVHRRTQNVFKCWAFISSQFSNPTCPTAGHAPLSMRVDYSSQVRNTPSIEAYTPYRGTLWWILKHADFLITFSFTAEQMIFIFHKRTLSTWKFRSTQHYRQSVFWLYCECYCTKYKFSSRCSCFRRLIYFTG